MKLGEGPCGTALYGAAAEGKLEAVKLLLEHGADLNIQGYIVLHYCTTMTNTEFKVAGLGLHYKQQRIKDSSK
jgi:predicted alpha/beta-hydrolase family hydrolase